MRKDFKAHKNDWEGSSALTLRTVYHQIDEGILQVTGLRVSCTVKAKNGNLMLLRKPSSMARWDSNIPIQITKTAGWLHAKRIFFSCTATCATPRG